jgi:hypothetical protein
MKGIRYFTTLLVGTAVVLAGLQTTTVMAHVLESDGDVAAVLHIPPVDAPQAGQVTTVGLAFSSSQPGFDIHDYAIRITVMKGGSKVLSAPVVSDSSSTHDGSASLTFPEAGAYQLVVDGKPLQGQRPFRLDFSVRADVAAGTVATGNKIGGVNIDFWVLNASCIAVLALVAQYAIRSGGRYSPVAAPKTIKRGSKKTPVQH